MVSRHPFTTNLSSSLSHVATVTVAGAGAGAGACPSTRFFQQSNPWVQEKRQQQLQQHYQQFYSASRHSFIQIPQPTSQQLHWFSNSIKTDTETTTQPNVTATYGRDHRQEKLTNILSASSNTCVEEPLKGDIHANSVYKTGHQPTGERNQAAKETSAMEPRMLYRYLHLETFSDNEFDAVFDQIVRFNPSSTLSKESSTSSTRNDFNDFTLATTTFQQQANTSDIVLTHSAISHFLLQRIHEFEEAAINPGNKQLTLSSVNTQEGSDKVDPLDYQRSDYANLQTHLFLQHFLQPSTQSSLSSKSSSSSSPPDTFAITKTHFRNTLRSMSETVDYQRTMPITLSMLMVGTSVGIMSPVMPFVVASIGLTAGQYGLVVSAFALAKIIGNVPSAVLVERHGRKPYMVHSLSIIALGTAGVGLAYSFEQLYVCRLLAGLGVAALSSASTLSIADLSNPRNRAQTMAPIMSAFAAGTALGPAMGGILADELGIHATFYVVGASFFGMMAVNQMLLNETKPQVMSFPWLESKTLKLNQKKRDSSIWNATKIAMAQWAPLWASPQIRNIVIINGFYWIALAGAQMTLLPLLLTDPNGLAMTATGVGQVYMGMSLVQVLGNPIVAKSVDKVGKVPAMVGGCTLIATSMATLPIVTDLTSVALTLGVWSTGSTLLSTAPVAYISDLTDDETRAQAIALMRTSGDVGFLLGASLVGALADWTGGLDVAMQSSAGVLLTATAWFGMRQRYLVGHSKAVESKSQPPL